MSRVCRAGAEYGKMRGEDSPYGDAWSFLTNEDGITNFWRDGLIRNRSFENVITMGMRGENDTAILGADATMEAQCQSFAPCVKDAESVNKRNNQ